MIRRTIFSVVMLFFVYGASSQNNMPVDSGMIYFEKGKQLTRRYQFVEAREQLLKAQKWFIMQNRQEYVGKTYIQLGFQTNRILLFEESHEYFYNAERIAAQHQLPDLDFYAKTAHAIAWLWDFSYSFDSLKLTQSREILTELRNRNKENIDNHIINDYLEVWGDYHFKTNRPDSALHYFNKSLTIALEDHNDASIANCYVNVAIYFNIKNEPDTVPFLLNEALVALENAPNSLLKRRIYVQWIAYYESIGDNDNAIKYHKLNNALHRKELMADRDLSLSNLSKDYEQQIFQAELSEKEVQIKFQQFVLITISVVLLLSVAFAISYFKLYKINAKLNLKNSYLLKEQNHRLKNNLQIISGLLNMQANRIKEEATRAIIESSQLRVHTIGLIHKQLYNKATDEVLMGAYGNDLINQIFVSFDITNVQKDVYFEEIYLPSEVVHPIGLIINELLTNSCKHAFPHKDKPWFYIRFVKRTDDSYKFTYKDNGPGFDRSKTTSKSSFGLSLIEIQIMQLNAKSNWKESGGTMFEMIFHIDKKSLLKDKQKNKKAIL